ncbi:cytochrome C oxidase subunit IV family protein [Neolewinella lacunae]|uniref:Cytochrome C oxidase subunit IV family protein n=1 Tax=Neolewinella lacunae TaxID=1517758 RepID=A0A923PN66_9BACT|nr:cytochrome C oxidase subunit IV family protein [Neolewinella lacunae]MBC6996539.1 cytochrome C oxidase subunit IV family protein [Neolewinella lacunae]MDN3634896.1 cytochrome C oxidase subunit IV family protein [Neolewinella lacunae]
MASHASYEDSKKAVWKGLGLLAAVTLAEVFLSLMKAAEWAEGMGWLFIIASLAIIILSIYKAYFIIYEFMHMAYEVRGLAMTVLLPMILLVWAVIAFFYEGDAWKGNRETVNERNRMEIKAEPASESPVGTLTPEGDLTNG